MVDTRILHVENDPYLAALIQGTLAARVPGLQIQLIENESDFRSRFEEIALNPPSLVIMDVMFPWSTGVNREVPPSDVAADGYYFAGFRCLRQLSLDHRTRGITTLVHSTSPLVMSSIG